MNISNSGSPLEHPAHEYPDHSSMLSSFLQMERRRLLRQFASLSPHSMLRGRGHNRFVYVPGQRPNRVLLVAHADTVWEHDGLLPVRLQIRGGVISSARKDAGIGADDRAGCAMLWALRHLGHSLLVTSGEEIGCRAARWLMQHPPLRSLADEINSTHQFAVQFDRQGSADFKCYDVGTAAFRSYCQTETGFTDAGERSSTDIRHLCKRICGVNLSTGYYDEHTEEERIVVAHWQNTLNTALRWLSKPELPFFPRD